VTELQTEEDNVRFASFLSFATTSFYFESFKKKKKKKKKKKRFVLPTTVAPRYTPWFSEPTPLGNTLASRLHLNIACVSLVGFDIIHSPTHAISHSINGTLSFLQSFANLFFPDIKTQQPKGNIASIGLQSGLSSLDKDFVLTLKYSQPHEPKVVIESDGKGGHAAMITLFPHLEFRETKAEVFLPPPPLSLSSFFFFFFIFFIATIGS